MWQIQLCGEISMVLHKLLDNYQLSFGTLFLPFYVHLFVCLFADKFLTNLNTSIETTAIKAEKIEYTKSSSRLIISNVLLQIFIFDSSIISKGFNQCDDIYLLYFGLVITSISYLVKYLSVTYRIRIMFLITFFQVLNLTIFNHNNINCFNMYACRSKFIFYIISFIINRLLSVARVCAISILFVNKSEYLKFIIVNSSLCVDILMYFTTNRFNEIYVIILIIVSMFILSFQQK